MEDKALVAVILLAIIVAASVLSYLFSSPDLFKFAVTAVLSFLGGAFTGYYLALKGLGKA